jgi:hypothetical protein
MEVDSLSDRITNIHQAYFNTSHLGLRDRNNENISFSSLLVEKCKRTIYQKRIEKNLFFL